MTRSSSPQDCSVFAPLGRHQAHRLFPFSTAIPDVNDTATAPDTASHILSVGIGFLCKESQTFIGLLTYGAETGFGDRKALGIDLADQAWLVESRTFTGSPNPTVNGTYQTTTHVGWMTMRVNF